jgi:hypothetical protein
MRLRKRGKSELAFFGQHFKKKRERDLLQVMYSQKTKGENMRRR